METYVILRLKVSSVGCGKTREEAELKLLKYNCG
jgi:hypothetical protein